MEKAHFRCMPFLFPFPFLMASFLDLPWREYNFLLDNSLSTFEIVLRREECFVNVHLKYTTKERAYFHTAEDDGQQNLAAIRTSISDDWSSTGFVDQELDSCTQESKDKAKERRDKERQKERQKVEKEKENEDGRSHMPYANRGWNAFFEYRLAISLQKQSKYTMGTRPSESGCSAPSPCTKCAAGMSCSWQP